MKQLGRHKNDKKMHAGRALFFLGFFIIVTAAASLLISQTPQLATMYWNWDHKHDIADSQYGVAPATGAATSNNSGGNNTPTSTPSNPTSTPPVVISIPAGDTTAYKFGIATGDTLMGLSSTNLANELNNIASLNIGWIRIDVAWNEVQPNSASVYDWGNVDRVIAAVTARNMKVLATLDYTPAWARSSSCPSSPDCEPANPGQFATFAAAAVSRYESEGVDHWEIWNEPNFGFWQPSPNVEDYLTLLKASYTVIKAIQPTSIVMTGGLAPAADGENSISPITFLTELYADGGEPYFDAVGMHPYSYPALPSYFATWNAWSQMASTTPSIRSVMAANGDANKQVWLTEFGAPTGGPGNEESVGEVGFPGSPDHVTEGLQAEMFSTAFNSLQNDQWAGPLFWYSYEDAGTSQDTNENFFGILRNDGSEKPIYSTIQSLLE